MRTELLHRTFEPETLTEVRAMGLPMEIATKLAHLVDLADTARAAALAVSERLRDAHDERREAEAASALVQAAVARQPGERTFRNSWMERTPADEADRRAARGEEPIREYGALPDVEGVARRLALATAEVDRLVPRATALAARRDATGRLADRCIGWTKSREPAALAVVLAEVGREARGIKLERDPARVTAALATVRAELATIAADRAAVERAPVPLAVATERALAVLDGIARWTPDVRGFFGAGYDPRFYADATALVPSMLEAEDRFRACVLVLLGEAIRGKVTAALKEAAADLGEQTLAPAERAKRLAALDAKARAAALREELLLSALEAAGVETLRREDAEPEVVLAVHLPDAASAVA